MPKYEFCRISYHVREIKGLFGRRHMNRWVALVDTPTEQRIIDQTPEFRPVQADAKKQFDELSKMVGGLLADGWEPVEFDHGQPRAFRRQVP